MTKTVTTFLNIRLENPDTGATINSFLSPGDTIEVVEVVKGALLEGNDVWFKLVDGTFVWSGGTNEDTSAHFLENIPVANNNNLPGKFILNTPIRKNGNGIIIGVCDSGIDINHPSLKLALLGEENCLTITHSPGIVNNHGTMVGGILVGNSNSITGLSIDARLRSFRTIGDGPATDEFGLKNALEKILNENIIIDVLNLSLNISKGSVPFFQEIINKVVARGIIITVAGNEGNITDLNHITKLNKVISIGVFNANDFQALKTSWFPGTIHVAYLNDQIITTSLAGVNNGHAPFGSSSAYTAVTSGLIARFLSQQFIPKESRFAAVMKYLGDCSFGIKNENQPTPLKPYKNE